MPLGDRLRHRPKRRLVRRGEIFNSDELEHGDVELEEVQAASEPAEEPSEPWAWRDKPMPDSVRERLQGYQDFLRQWRADHHDDPTGDEPAEMDAEVAP